MEKKQKDWREKYYNSLDELEAKEEQWAAVETILRQGILRLTHMAHSDDAALRAELKSLRDAIQSGAPSGDLLPLINALSDTLLKQNESLLIARSAGEVLLALLDKLELPGALVQEGERLRQKLLQTTTEQALDEAIEILARLVARVRQGLQQERSDLEYFLKQLTSRLQEIDSGIRENALRQQESFDGGTTLNSAVQKQVQAIEQSVSDDDVIALKETVRRRVETIREHLKEFCETEEQRLKQSQTQVEKLQLQLQQAQGETHRLREQMDREREQALRDSLTGIANRYAYDLRVVQEEARWQRYNSPLALSVWDLDGFKRINDEYGHQAGDKVLSVVAKLLQNNIRTTDFIARYGGEEFVLLLPETTLENAQSIAESLRSKVEQAEFHFRGQRVVITISCGISEFRQGDKHAAVFERADQALYKAKRAGKNRCVSA